MKIHVRVLPKGWKIYRMNGLCVFPKRDRTERRLFVFGVIPPPPPLSPPKGKIDFFLLLDFFIHQFFFFSSSSFS